MDTKLTREHKLPYHASLEGLPIELRLKVLEKVSDPDTLRRLVHASPSYYWLYYHDRAHIWTRMTLRNLASRGVNVLEESAPCVQVSFQDDAPSEEVLHFVLRACYRRMQAGEAIELGIDNCKALLKITDAVRWKTERLPDQKEKLQCSRAFFDAEIRGPGRLLIADERPADWRLFLGNTEKKELFPKGTETYHTFSFGDEFGPRVNVQFLKSDFWDFGIWLG